MKKKPNIKPNVRLRTPPPTKPFTDKKKEQDRTWARKKNDEN